MKQTIFIAFAICHGLLVVGQNVGIMSTPPLKARLDVAFGPSGSNTVAIFGAGENGISIQRNPPAIGFNQYRDDLIPGAMGKYMANGFAASQALDPATGVMSFTMFPSGTANVTTPAGVQAITVLNNGNTGIRTTNPTATLTVARGDAGNNGAAVFLGGTHASHFYYSTGEETYIRAGVNGSNVYVNNIPNGDVYIGYSSSRVGINTLYTNPFYTLEVVQPNGQKAVTLVDGFNYRWSMAANFINTPSNGTGVALDFYYNNSGKGRFQFWNGAYVAFSDSSLKTSIQPLGLVLDKLSRLQPVRYEMKTNNPHHARSFGFIAQDVKPFFPQLVRQVSDENRKGPFTKDMHVMDYTGFGVIAIKALQEQWAEIQNLEKENKLLLERMDALKIRLDQVE